MSKKILILGDARHGKDTVAEMICSNSELKCISSSKAALDIFLYDILNNTHNLCYESKKEAFEDRVNHRDIWYNEICKYNGDDKLKLAKDILNLADIYVGMRNKEEAEPAIQENVFDYIIGVYNYRKPRESSASNTADVFKYSDFIITNNGTLEELLEKVKNMVLKVIK